MRSEHPDPVRPIGCRNGEKKMRKLNATKKKPECHCGSTRAATEQVHEVPDK
jgi:hypothetical protein